MSSLIDLSTRSHGIARKDLRVNSDDSISEPLLRGQLARIYTKARYTSVNNMATALQATDFAYQINFVAGFTVTSLNMPSAMDLAQVLQRLVGSIELDNGTSPNYTSIEVTIRNDTNNNITLNSLDVNTLFFLDPTSGAVSSNIVVPANSFIVLAITFTQLGLNPIIKLTQLSSSTPNIPSDGIFENITVTNLADINTLQVTGASDLNTVTASSVTSTNVTAFGTVLATTFQSNGGLTTISNNGISLPNDQPDAFPAILDYYETATVPLTVQGAWDPVVQNITFVRIGRICVVSFPNMQRPTTTPGVITNSADPFPARFRPFQTFFGVIRTIQPSVFFGALLQ